MKRPYGGRVAEADGRELWGPSGAMEIVEVDHVGIGRSKYSIQP
jgi:hypothetical protein